MKRSKQEVAVTINKIRKLTEEDHLSDYKIIHQLKMPESTYYWYKKRIQKQDAKIWDKVAKDSVKYHATKLLQSFEDCYFFCQKLMDDPKVDARTKLEASKTQALARRHMLNVVQHGPMVGYELPTPVLPVIQEVKEIETDN